ncbi:RCC1 domain-containing protein 1 isoform X4 [Buteo buteo]|uniref:RCC1 domain-containing protein 1 isoform X4 n=1 Tax=Buteo buteo TaxID=30397 RepID=UPI003EB72458
MAAPRRAWLVFGFSTEEAAGEPGPGPGPRRLESGPEGIRRVWPAWSYVVVETGERPPPGRCPGSPFLPRCPCCPGPAWRPVPPSALPALHRDGGVSVPRGAGPLGRCCPLRPLTPNPRNGNPHPPTAPVPRDVPFLPKRRSPRGVPVPPSQRRSPRGVPFSPPSAGPPAMSPYPVSAPVPPGVSPSLPKPRSPRGVPVPPAQRPSPRGVPFPPPSAGPRDVPLPAPVPRDVCVPPPPGADGPAAAGAGLEVRSAGLRRRLPPGWTEALPSETHLVLRGPAAARAWPRAAALRGELREAAAWSRALPPPGPRRPPPLPLLPGGFATPRPPFFAALPGGVRVRRLALGQEHVLALGAAGEAYAWGGGRHGQLGHGTLESELQPRLVEALAGVPMQAVAAGGWHSASVSETGDLYMWGWNESGQLALPSKALAEERAQDEDPGAGVPGIAGSAPGPGGQQGGGELYTWGWGKYGQLGHKDNASSDQPRRVEYLVAEGLRAEEVVCGPWTTYICVLEP